MATKKVVTSPSKKVTKNEVVKVKQVRLSRVPVSLVEFSVTAVIPVQQYSNIQPKITVTAPSYEEAKAFVMPLIEELFREYAETKPAFLGKVTETIRTVVPAIAGVELSKGQLVKETGPQDVPAPQPTASSATPKPESVLKAEKMIGLATSNEAAVLIQEKIETSVKIPDEFKPDLITLVLKKRNEFK
jgi:hypothetical protein